MYFFPTECYASLT